MCYESEAKVRKKWGYGKKKSEPPEWEAPKRFDYCYKLLSRLTYRNCADNVIVVITDRKCNSSIGYLQS